VVLPDGRVLLELEEISAFAIGTGARTQPFDGSVRGYFDALDFLFLGLPTAGARFDTFERAAASAVDRVPVPSGATSFAWEYDSTLETFVPVESPFAPAISQNARSNGRGVLAIGFAYTHVEYEQLDSADKENVRFSAFGGPLPNVFGTFPEPGADFVGRFDFKLKQQIFAFSANYGVLENLDVGVLVPLIDMDFRGRLNGRFFGVTGDGGYRALRFDDEGNLVHDDRLPTVYRGIGGIDNEAFAGLAGLESPDVGEAAQRVPFGATHQEDDFGVGDLVLRSRYYAGSVGGIDVGGVFNVSAPTGDDANLIGLDAWRFDPRVLVSKTTGLASGHVNLGYHADTDDGDRDRFDYSVGGEVRLCSWATFLLDQVGRMELRGDAPIRAFDIVPGIKVNPWRELILGFNAIVPLNDEGLTTDFTPNAAVEATLVF
jgi:hypothetical protein